MLSGSANMPDNAGEESENYYLAKILETIQTYGGMSYSSSGGNAVQEYIVNISQTGTDAPTTVTMKNDIGVTADWARTGIGRYEVELPSILDITRLKVSHTIGGDETKYIIAYYAVAGLPSVPKIFMRTREDSGGWDYADGIVANGFVHMAYYPE